MSSSLTRSDCCNHTSLQATAQLLPNSAGVAKLLKEYPYVGSWRPDRVKVVLLCSVARPRVDTHPEGQLHKGVYLTDACDAWFVKRLVGTTHSFPFKTSDDLVAALQDGSFFIAQTLPYGVLNDGTAQSNSIRKGLVDKAKQLREPISPGHAKLLQLLHQRESQPDPPTYVLGAGVECWSKQAFYKSALGRSGGVVVRPGRAGGKRGMALRWQVNDSYYSDLDLQCVAQRLAVAAPAASGATSAVTAVSGAAVAAPAAAAAAAAAAIAAAIAAAQPPAPAAPVVAAGPGGAGPLAGGSDRAAQATVAAAAVVAALPAVARTGVTATNSQAVAAAAATAAGTGAAAAAAAANASGRKRGRKSATPQHVPPRPQQQQQQLYSIQPELQQQLYSVQQQQQQHTSPAEQLQKRGRTELPDSRMPVQQQQQQQQQAHQQQQQNGIDTGLLLLSQLDSKMQADRQEKQQLHQENQQLRKDKQQLQQEVDRLRQLSEEYKSRLQALLGAQ